MSTPISTYRVQLHRDFTLQHLRGILPYLHELGITTIYASPVFEAVPGSTHGYDVLNPHRINPELGTEADLLDISQWLHQHGMTWLQDIVPNHMSARPENPWLRDVLEKGPLSPYQSFFDINWQHPQYPGQFMVPLLDQSLIEALAAGQIMLQWQPDGLVFQYYEHSLPLGLPAYDPVLALAAGEAHPLTQAARRFAGTPPGQYMGAAAWARFKTDLHAWTQTHPHERDATSAHYNTDSEALLALLQTQHFRLVPWQETDKAINYRRFFTINDLLCLRMERQDTFDEYHRYIKSLFERGMIQSLRIDHVDGLYDPKQYLQRLRGLVGDDTYIVVEKILEPHEYLPSDWPCQGTTGYDFLSLVNRLLINDRTADSLSETYAELHVLAYDYQEAVYRKKLFMLIHHMGGELDNLTAHLLEIATPYTPTDEMRTAYRQVLAYWLVSFPVYRLYLQETHLSDENARALAAVFAEARVKAPENLAASFDELQGLLMPEPGSATDAQLRFLMRTQQFTGPLMAKGVEDTAFYVYNRLISRNEVGDTPQADEPIGVNRFHAEMRRRAPHTLNTTATHDTKRGEDVRMRINVLSELPDEWRRHVTRWQELALPYCSQEGGKPIPDPNDAYFLYQTLVGTYPLHADPDRESYPARLAEYLTKVMKEAKVHTSWSQPDEAYETGVVRFAENLLADAGFQASFVPFAGKVARYGALYSLVQVLIRLTAPGVPDTYQGTEFWDLSMVDPDNRRPVDYAERQRLLQERVPQLADAGQLAAALRNPLDPALKLFVLHRLLLLRRQLPELFLHGSYRPLVTAGRRARQVAGYVRHHERQRVLVVFPLEIPALCNPDCLPVGDGVWEDTYIGWEDEAADYTSLFTHETLRLTARQPVAALLARFPIGCWVSGGTE